MCGIAGLFAKTPGAQATLGADLAGMLGQLVDRGPDSAGLAVYRDPLPAGSTKVSVLHRAGTRLALDTLTAGLGAAVGATDVLADRGDQAVLAVTADDAAVRAWLAVAHPELLVLSTGIAIETAKRVGHAEALIDATALRDVSGSHALTHTRMATESLVSTAGSHPFSTGHDLCLVHNGSLSNHCTLRRGLIRRGVSFQTDNDSEVAAGYLTWRLLEGDTLDQALEAALEDLDGFFTFAVGARDGFAVLRDPIACKPAILAETDDWVAMASEYRAIATLPGAADAQMWEPEPAQIYSWTREPVAA